MTFRRMRPVAFAMLLFGSLTPACLPQEHAKSFDYTNRRYGFTLSLPISWKGFTVLSEEWSAADAETGKMKEHGPVITVRHPLWTKAKPRQDIPIMVLTPVQWEMAEKEQIVFGAAPIGPSELARNRKFVFALPPRYNFAYPEGFQEVEDIIGRKSFRAFDAANADR